MSDMGDPFIGLARASAVTTTLKLGTGICLVPEHHPLLLAKEIATLNHLSTAVSVRHWCWVATRRRRSWGVISRIDGVKPGKRCK